MDLPILIKYGPNTPVNVLGLTRDYMIGRIILKKKHDNQFQLNINISLSHIDKLVTLFSKILSPSSVRTAI